MSKVLQILSDFSANRKPFTYGRDVQGPNFTTTYSLHPDFFHRLNCAHNQFQCKEKCIEAEWHCDGEDDCVNGFDEVNCPKGCTGPNKFECSDGTCITAACRCDGDHDCDDRSDEVWDFFLIVAHS